MLDELLYDLREQDYADDMQIIVVEETDDPRPLEGVDYIPHPMKNMGIAYARNLAVAHAKHEIVVFVDDDCRMDEGWLSALVGPLLEDEAVLGAQGGVTVPEGTNAIGWAETLLGFPGGGVTRIHQSGGKAQVTIEVSTLNAAYRKQAVLQAGGFSEAARLGGEDYLLAKRVTEMGRLLFVPDAVVQHAARGSFVAIWRWFMRRGMAEAALWRAGLAPDFASFMLRASIVVKLLPLLVLVPWVGWWLPLLLPVMIIGTTWWRLRWAWRDGEVPVPAVMLAPMVRMVMDMAADVGRFKGWLADMHVGPVRHGRTLEQWVQRKASIPRKAYAAIVGWSFIGGWIRMREVAAVLPTLSIVPGNVLDAGCGMGAFTILLARWFPCAHMVAADWESTDRFRGQLDEVRQMANALGLENVEVRKLNLLRMRQRERYDLILNVDVLEHIPENLRVMRAFHRALKPGGILLLHMPVKGIAASSSLFPEIVMRGLAEEHVGEMYDAHELIQALGDAGFSRVTVRTTFHWFAQKAWEWDKIIYHRLHFAYPLLFPLLKSMAWMDRVVRIGRGYGVLAIASRGDSQ